MLELKSQWHEDVPFKPPRRLLVFVDNMLFMENIIVETKGKWIITNKLEKREQDEDLHVEDSTRELPRLKRITCDLYRASSRGKSSIV